MTNLELNLRIKWKGAQLLFSNIFVCFPENLWSCANRAFWKYIAAPAGLLIGIGVTPPERFVIWVPFEIVADETAFLSKPAYGLDNILQSYEEAGARYAVVDLFGRITRTNCTQEDLRSMWAAYKKLQDERKASAKMLQRFRTNKP